MTQIDNSIRLDRQNEVELPKEVRGLVPLEILNEITKHNLKARYVFQANVKLM